MTREARIQFVADALEQSDKKESGYADMARALYVRLAEAAIAAYEATLEVTDEMCDAFTKDAFALVAGKDQARVKFHVWRALEAVLRVMKS